MPVLIEGNSEKTRLATLFRQQKLINSIGDANAIALDLAKVAKHWRYRKGERLYTKNDKGEDKGLFFILVGEVKLFDGGRIIATVGEDEHVGEIPLVQPKVQNYTVTAIVAAKQNEIAQVSYRDLRAIADTYKDIWINMAAMASIRLTNANKLRQGPSNGRLQNIDWKYWLPTIAGVISAAAACLVIPIKDGKTISQHLVDLFVNSR